MISIKTIGIIARPFKENNKKYMGIRKDLLDSLKKYNTEIILIPITLKFIKIKHLIDLCDGIILSGGDYFTNNDFKIVEYLYENSKPTLGICLGMQSMGEYFNNYKEIKVTKHKSNERYVHKVIIKKGTLLYKIIKKRCIYVNSRHKTAIKEFPLTISAYSKSDKVIEAIEDTSKRFFLGVQWHPESIQDKYSKRIFTYFINIM